MNIAGRKRTKSEILQRVGNAAQLGYVRRYELTDGKAKGVSAIDVATGGGLQFTVLPDRGLDISLARYNGINLSFLTATGETSPHFYEPSGIGWLRTFAGGLLTTCGLSHFGPPAADAVEPYGLHGRYSTLPAASVNSSATWDGDDYRLEVSGIVEDARIFGDKLRLTRVISAMAGENRIVIDDTLHNFGYQRSAAMILYHFNLGFPLVDDGASVHIDGSDVQPRDPDAAPGLPDWRKVIAPVPGYREQAFFHTMKKDVNGLATASIMNPALLGGLSLKLSFTADTLPYLTEWKMMGQGDYVIGLEPGSAPVMERSELIKRGLLRYLDADETRSHRIELSVSAGE